MLNEQLLLEQAFHIGAAADWEIGLYLSGGDPLTDLENVEVANSRVLLDGLMEWNGVDALSNSATVTCGPLPSCTIGGWFISSTGSTDITWTAAITPIGVSSDDVVVFTPGTISLNIA